MNGGARAWYSSELKRAREETDAIPDDDVEALRQFKLFDPNDEYPKRYKHLARLLYTALCKEQSDALFTTYKAQEDGKALAAAHALQTDHVATLKAANAETLELRQRVSILEGHLAAVVRERDAQGARLSTQFAQMAAAHQGRLHTAREDAARELNTHALGIMDTIGKFLNDNASQSQLLEGQSPEEFIAEVVEHIDAMRTALGSHLC